MDAAAWQVLVGAQDSLGYSERLPKSLRHELLEDLVHIHQKARSSDFPSVGFVGVPLQYQAGECYHLSVMRVQPVERDFGYVPGRELDEGDIL